MRSPAGGVCWLASLGGDHWGSVELWLGALSPLATAPSADLCAQLAAMRHRRKPQTHSPAPPHHRQDSHGPVLYWARHGSQCLQRWTAMAGPVEQWEAAWFNAERRTPLLPTPLDCSLMWSGQIWRSAKPHSTLSAFIMPHNGCLGSSADPEVSHGRLLNVYIE